MKRLLFTVFSAAALACAAEVSVIELGRGVTIPEVSPSIRKIERIEAFTDTSSATLTVKQLRGLVDIPYISHRTNDGSVVEWKVTEGTTFNDYYEKFEGPIQDSSGNFHPEVPYVSSPVYRIIDNERIRFYGLYTSSGGVNGYAPCVDYSFPSNALFDVSVDDYPAKWHYFGTPGAPGPHRYVPNLTVYDKDWRVVHSGAAVVSTLGYDSASWVDVYTTNVTQESYQIGGGWFYRPVTNVTVSKEARYAGDNVTCVTNWINEAADRLNPYSGIVFAGVEMPTNLVVDASGATQPIRFVPGHTVTNFAVWSTFSAQATNVLWTANPAKGTITATNLSGTSGYLLPGDRLLTEGTTLPTGQVILYVSDGK